VLQSIVQHIEQSPICGNKLIKLLPSHEGDAVDAMSEEKDCEEKVENTWNRLIIMNSAMNL